MHPKLEANPCSRAADQQKERRPAGEKTGVEKSMNAEPDVWARELCDRG